MPTTLARPRLLLRGLLLPVLLLPGVTGPPAQAHPFGPPLQATLTQDGPVLTLTWTGAEDDWMVLGEHTGAFASGATGEQILADSPGVHDYLGDRVAVTGAGGQECEQSLSMPDPVEEGAQFEFSCPEGTTEVGVTVEVLTDVNAAYRTVLDVPGGEPGQVLFTATEPSHAVSLDADGGGRRGDLTLVAGVTAAIGAGLALLVRSRSRQRERS